MGNSADVLLSAGLGIVLGVASGLLLAVALVKPIEKVLDNYEGTVYSKVWEAKQGSRREDEGDDKRLERAEEDGVQRLSVAADKSELVDAG